MTGKLKVVTFGSVNGAIERLLENMNKINSSKAGPFDLFLIVGELFIPTELSDKGTEQLQLENEKLAERLLENEFQFPVPTYFIAGSAKFPERIVRRALSNSGELCPNLTFLGKSGILTLSDGARLGFLSGELTEDSELANSESELNSYHSGTIDNLLSKSNQYVDILLTYNWPESIEVNSEKAKALEESTIPKKSAVVSKLAAHFNPKYHFATSAPSLFFEREPYKVIASTEPDTPQHLVTRFISLGESEPATGQRWYYAFNLNLGHRLFSSSELPNNITGSPYAQPTPTKTKRLYTEVEPTSFFSDPKLARSIPSDIPPDSYTCKICNIKGHYIKSCPQKTQRDHTARKPFHCWFCLANPDLAKHLIVSIGDNLYASLAKGSLTDPFSPTCLVPGGGNLLLLTINHYPSYSRLPPTDHDKIHQELAQYKTALTAFYKKYEASPLYYELHAPGDFKHAHKQVIPIPTANCADIEEFFITKAKEHHWDLSEHHQGDPAVGFLEVELPSGKTLIGLPPASPRLDFQLPRKILAEFLGIPERADWRQIDYSLEQERALQADFKAAFTSFDPSAP